jgi:hypothetical protein
MTYRGAYSLASQNLYISRRPGPLGRQRDQTNITFRGVLPTLELVQVGRTHPLDGMRAARAVVRGDVRTFYMKGLHGLSVMQPRACAVKISKGGEHLFRRTCDYSGKAAGDASRKHGCERTPNIL